MSQGFGQRGMAPPVQAPPPWEARVSRPVHGTEPARRSSSAGSSRPAGIGRLAWFLSSLGASIAMPVIIMIVTGPKIVEIIKAMHAAQEARVKFSPEMIPPGFISAVILSLIIFVVFHIFLAVQFGRRMQNIGKSMGYGVGIYAGVIVLVIGLSTVPALGTVASFLPFAVFLYGCFAKSSAEH